MQNMPASANGQVRANPRFWEPRSAYIHVPFCRHRCGYCNFTLVAGRDDLVAGYLEALERELRGLERPHEMQTLFFGGGTPTHLDPRRLRHLNQIVQTWLPLSADHEFTVEANPLDVDSQRLRVLRDFGVNRMSLGVQSFDERKLGLLERDHRPDDILQAYGLAIESVDAVSIDLIFGVPQETLSDWQDDLQAALQLRPRHISLYGLTWERGTRFWGKLLKGQLTRCDEDIERDMYVLAIETLSAAGYEHYEVSNFALPGYRCRHNEAYWTGRTYFAAGPGAARYVDGRREMNHRSTTTYVRRVLAGKSPVAESETLSPEESARERLVFGLRRLDGVDERIFLEEAGIDIRALGGTALDRFLELGLLRWADSTLRLTREGLLVSDSLWPELL